MSCERTDPLLKLGGIAPGAEAAAGGGGAGGGAGAGGGSGGGSLYAGSDGLAQTEPVGMGSGEGRAASASMYEAAF